MGAINHYWLIPLSLAQPDIPLSFDINHDFFIIDPLLAAQREESTVDIDSSPSSSLRPTFGPLSVMLYHYQTLLMWNLWDARCSSFSHDSTWMHEPQGGVNNAEAAQLILSSSFPLQPQRESNNQIIHNINHINVTWNT